MINCISFKCYNIYKKANNSKPSEINAVCLKIWHKNKDLAVKWKYIYQK